MSMRVVLSVAFMLALVWTTGRRAFARVELDFDGMLKVDGQRMLVLGCYENPGTDEGLTELAAAGFNLIRASATKESLDRLVAHGLHGWINLGGNLDLSTAAEPRSKALAETVTSLREHPALWVWEGPDEALWNIYYSPMLRERAEYDRLRAEIEKRKAGGEEMTALERAWAEVEAARQEADHEGEMAARQELYARLGEQPPDWPYTLAEAPARAQAAAEGFLDGYRLLKRLDPGHPLWFNHAPRNGIAALAEFNRACDIGGCDIYPVPERQTGHSDLGDRTLAAVGAYTERMKLVGEGDPVWMVLQGFGWWDLASPEGREEHPEREERGRRPRYDETRFMAYDALVHGATGILYYGTYAVEKDSQFWADLKQVIGELAALRPLLEASTLAWRPEVQIVESGPSCERGLQVMAKQYAGALYLVVVNEEREPLAFSLRGLDAVEGLVFHRLGEGDTVPVREGALADSIRGYGVSIYASGDAFDSALPKTP